MAQTRQLCTFLLDGLLFGVDVVRVQEVIRYQQMTPVPLAPPVICGLINLRGQIVLALDMRARLEFAPRAAGELPMNVVIRSETGPVSLLVDEIADVVEVQQDTFEPAPETMSSLGRELITGVYKLDGSLLLLLDTDRAIKVDRSGGPTPMRAEDRTTTRGASLVN
jgi:purine-binding chemotaxis protein CheW